MYHGNNLIPEGLELGEIKINAVANLDCLKPICVVAYSRNPYTDGLTQQQPTGQGIIANGVPNGVFYCICSIDMLQGLLSTINGAGFGESIITVFTVPALAVVGFNNWTIQDIISGGLLSWLVTDFKATPIEKTLVTLPSELDGYTPRNQKLRTYPYLYLGFSPQNGSQKIYRYEDFTNGVPVFKICSELNQNPSICFIPKNYRGSTNENLQDISVLKGYPTIGWITEYFNSWLAQNSDIISIQMAQEEYNYEHNQVISQGQNVANTLGTLLSGAMNGNIGAGLVGSDFAFNQEKLKMNTQNHYYYIDMMMSQKEKQSLLPNPANLSGSSATLLGYDYVDNSIFTRYSIKRQFAERIDKFFDMYGYLTNTLKVPNLNNRPNWNFIKTIGCNVIGDIPQEDIETIKAMFDTGITLWHNTATFLDYSQNNR